MLSEKVRSLLDRDMMPRDWREFEESLERDRKQGFHIPTVAFDKMVVTQEQAVRTLKALGIDPRSDFYVVMKQVGNFPGGQGSDLYNLDQIVNPATLTYWDEEYPELSTDYLPLTSIEGEGSYFYRKSTGAVYDVGWGDMGELAAGHLAPRWPSFGDFLDWYYELT